MPRSTRNPRKRHDECRNIAAFLNVIRRAAIANPAIAHAVIRALIATANRIPRAKVRDEKGRFCYE